MQNERGEVDDKAPRVLGPADKTIHIREEGSNSAADPKSAGVVGLHHNSLKSLLH